MVRVTQHGTGAINMNIIQVYKTLMGMKLFLKVMMRSLLLKGAKMNRLVQRKKEIKAMMENIMMVTLMEMEQRLQR